jgi:hypothetical protein
MRKRPELQEGVDVALTRLELEASEQVHALFAHVSVGSKTTSFGMIVRRVSDAFHILTMSLPCACAMLAIFMIMRFTPSHTVSVP